MRRVRNPFFANQRGDDFGSTVVRGGPAFSGVSSIVNRRRVLAGICSSAGLAGPVGSRGFIAPPERGVPVHALFAPVYVGFKPGATRITV